MIQTTEAMDNACAASLKNLDRRVVLWRPGFFGVVARDVLRLLREA